MNISKNVVVQGATGGSLPAPALRCWDLDIRLAAGPGWLRSAMPLWYHRSRTRRALRQLDDRALADIGITRAQRAAECGKWFWQP